MVAHSIAFQNKKLQYLHGYNVSVITNFHAVHLTLKTTCAQFIETSVIKKSSFQNYLHPNDHLHSMCITNIPQSYLTLKQKN